jgi:dextranase
MPYLAVYAASAAFWRDHLDWALYDQSGQPIPFGEDFLGLMDPSDGSPWKQHLLEECRKVLTDLRFDGLHIDQYGEPRVVFDHAGHSVDLPKAFRDFIYSAVKLHPGKPVLFNAVANWPIETLASAPTAFNYIEIWPPDVHYPDLVRIVRNARRLSGGKPVVIALYIPARRMTQIRLADALIHSAGGGRIELGENERLLSDPYFPRHEALSDELRSNLRCTSDFWVRYEEWFSAPELEGGQDLVHAPEGIETFVRKVGANWAVSLVNLTGMNDCCWNEDHDGPQGVAFTLEAKLPRHVLRVWLASPDDGSPQARPAEFEYHGQTIRVKVSRLSIWNVLFFETERV